MIVLRNLTKTFVLEGQRKTVLQNVNAVFPSNVAVGLLGRNGAGKSTLINLISGAMDVTSGEILTDGQISFPVGYSGSFHPDMTGAQNTRFTARIYGVDTDELTRYVEEFAELGPSFHLPVRSYSSGMRARLAFGVSMGISFDTYLIDEVTAVGDARFKRKSQQVFEQKIQSAGVLFVSHSLGQVRELCKAGAVIEGGNLYYYDDVDEAIEHHLHNLEA
ncbi:MAG TPA: ABC transporter ATP-binding protein [Rubellimicrobium sp.]|jgi:capsular polysaccharide transport system ATP-binding protein|nr:ABC transporter ATP-binding protein [Rubellimicrobium sp.]